MDITAYNITYIISNLFTVYIVKLFMDKYLEIEPKYKKTVYGAYGGFFVITTTLYFLYDIPIVMMAINILCFFGISLFYKGSLKNKIVASLYIYIVLFVIEILVTALTFTSFMSPFEKYGYSNILGLFIDKMLQFFSVLILRSRFANKKESDDMIPLKISMYSLIIPISTIIIEMIITSIYEVSQVKVSISVVVLFMINFIAFALYNSLLEIYKDKIKNITLNQEREYFYRQCLIMQKAVEDTQSFRHDFNNHMSILNELISKKEFPSAEKYIDNLREDHQKYVSVYSATGNIPIDSILNYKLNSLSDKNIDINIDIDINVPIELPVEIIDISTILANLLDNADSALSKVENDKQLKIKIVYKKGMLVISISNSYNGIVLYENGEIVTTKKNRDRHGKGLSNVRKTVEKYNGLLKFTHDENIFTSEVLLYLT